MHGFVPGALLSDFCLSISSEDEIPSLIDHLYVMYS